MVRLISIVFFLNLLSTLSIGQSYQELSYDSLVIYDFDWMGRGAKHRSIIDDGGNLPPTIKKSVKLAAKEAKELTARIESPESYDMGVAACFDPHFGMVYWENGKPKEYITICFSCNFPRGSLPIDRTRGKENMSEEERYKKSGFSKSFRKYLSELKQKYEFSHWKLDSQLFDN